MMLSKLKEGVGFKGVTIDAKLGLLPSVEISLLH